MRRCVPRLAGVKSALRGLVQHLSLERIERGIYRGSSCDLGWGRIYGGQVVAQALGAAQLTLPEDGRSIHSLHSYFLLPGDPRQSVVYDVEDVRDGGSFSARRFKAIQNGEPIFFMTASFQTAAGEDDLPSLEHESHASLRSVPLPEECESKSIVMQRHAEHIPKPLRARLTATDAWSTPIEIKVVDMALPGAHARGEATPPSQEFWFRAACPRTPAGARALSDDPRVHEQILAYASDFGLLATALRPYPFESWSPEMQCATIDHSMWYHRAFRADEWLFARFKSPVANGGRGLAHGEIFSRDEASGEFITVASVSQEGVMRQRRARPR